MRRSGQGGWRNQGRDAYTNGGGGGNWGAPAYDPYGKREPQGGIYDYRTDRRDMPHRDMPRSGGYGGGGMQGRSNYLSFRQPPHRGPRGGPKTNYGPRNDYNSRLPPNRNPGPGARQDRPRKRPFVGNSSGSSYRPSNKRPRIGSKSNNVGGSGNAGSGGSNHGGSGGSNKSRRSGGGGAGGRARRVVLRPATLILGSGVPGEAEEHTFLSVRFQTHPYIRPTASINNESGAINFEIQEVSKYGPRHKASRCEFSILERDISTILAFEGDKIPEDIVKKVEEVVDLTQENNEDDGKNEADAEKMDEDAEDAAGDPAADGEAAKDGDEPTPSEQLNPDGMTCQELRKELKKRGLASGGLKAELIGRLKESLEEAAQGETAAAPAAENENDAAAGQEDAAAAAPEQAQEVAPEPAAEPAAETPGNAADKPISPKKAPSVELVEDTEGVEGGRADETEPAAEPVVEVEPEVEVEATGTAGGGAEPPVGDAEAPVEPEAAAGGQDGDQEQAEAEQMAVDEGEKQDDGEPAAEEAAQDKEEEAGDGENAEGEEAKKDPAKPVTTTSYRVVIGLKRSPRLSRRADTLLPRELINKARVLILEFALISNKDDSKKAFTEALEGPFKKIANGNVWPLEGTNSFKHTLTTLLSEMQQARANEKRMAGANAMFLENQDLKKEKLKLEGKIKDLQDQLERAKKRIKRAKEALN